MPKRDPLEEALAELKALASTPDKSAAATQLAKHLGGKYNVSVARASKLAGEWKLDALEPDLVRAFDRFMKSGSDKGCTAKTEIARALDQLSSRNADVFVAGIHHFQPEAAWGPPVDVAAELRGICAAALVRLNFRDVLVELADLLMDGEPAARIAAARAIAYRGGADDGGALLRLKLLAGDDHIDVTIECLDALLKLAPVKSLPYVIERFVDARELDEDLRNAALLAIGETRTPDAARLLMERWQKQVTLDQRKPLLLAMALTRQSPAIEFLVNVIKTEHKKTATAAIEAMKLYRNDESTRTKLDSAVEQRAHEDVTSKFREIFGG